MVRGRLERSAPCLPRPRRKINAGPAGRAATRLPRAARSGTVGDWIRREGTRKDRHRVRADRRPSRRPRHGESLRRRAHGAERASLGRDRAFSGRRPARGRGARHGGDLREREAWRQRHDPPRRGADLRGAVDRLPVRGVVPLHPQHGRLGRRPVRLAGAQRPLSAAPRQHGADRELLPDRARRRLRRRGADHARPARRGGLTCSTASSSSSPAPAQATSIW